jgi:hypothetical protein
MDKVNNTAFTTMLVNYQDFENNLISYTAELKKNLLIDKNGSNAFIKAKSKEKQKQYLDD